MILYEDGDSEEVNLKELKQILVKVKDGVKKRRIAQENAKIKADKIKIKADKIAAQSLARNQRAGRIDDIHFDLRAVFSAFNDRGPHLARINA
jgi:hypothetical protein